MSSPWASTHASASCAGVTPLSAASSLDLARRGRGSSGSSRPGSAARCGGSRRRRGRRSSVIAPGQEAAAERASRRRSRCPARGRSAGPRPRGRASTASTRSAARRSGARRARGGSSPAPPRDRPRWRTLPSAPARPSRRRSPRSACSGRRGAGSRGRCGRRRGAAARPSQRALHVLGPAVDAALGRVVGVADDAELRRQHDLVAAAGDRPADELLVGVRAVHVGGVEQRTPSSSARWIVAIDSSSSRGAVELGHAHAAEAEGGDGGAVGAERRVASGEGRALRSQAVSSVPALSLRALTKRYDDGTLALDALRPEIPDGALLRPARPQRRRQDHADQLGLQPDPRDHGEIAVFGARPASRAARAARSGSPSRTSTSTASSTSRRRCSTTAATTGWTAPTPRRRAEEMIDVFDLRAKARRAHAEAVRRHAPAAAAGPRAACTSRAS